MFGLKEFHSRHPGHGPELRVHFPQMHDPFWGGWRLVGRGGVKILGYEIEVLPDRFFRADSESGISFFSFGLYQLLD